MTDIFGAINADSSFFQKYLFHITTRKNNHSFNLPYILGEAMYFPLSQAFSIDITTSGGYDPLR